MTDRQKRLFLFYNGDILLTAEGHIPVCHTLPDVLWRPHAVTRIECAGQKCVVCVVHQTPDVPAGFQFIPLQKAFLSLDTWEYGMAAKCAELSSWHSASLYCGSCGTPLVWSSPIGKRCPRCGREWWPSLAIAIIVRISRGDEILMVHARNFRGDFYGLVAGFVETGETLEECVRREVREETGLEIGDIRYFGSQTWPYPCGLMVGFTADYQSGTLCLQQSELSSGGWFTLDNLPQIPEKGSISRDLIDDWINRMRGKVPDGNKRQ